MERGLGAAWPAHPADLWLSARRPAAAAVPARLPAAVVPARPPVAVVPARRPAGAASSGCSGPVPAVLLACRRPPRCDGGSPDRRAEEGGDAGAGGPGVCRCCRREMHHPRAACRKRMVWRTGLKTRLCWTGSADQTDPLSSLWRDLTKVIFILY